MIVCLTGTPLANLFRGGFIYCNHEGSDVGHRSELCDQGVEAAAVSMGVHQTQATYTGWTFLNESLGGRKNPWRPDLVSSLAP